MPVECATQPLNRKVGKSAPHCRVEVMLRMSEDAGLFLQKRCHYEDTASYAFLPPCKIDCVWGGFD